MTESWRVVPNTSIDRWEARIRDWITRQTSGEDGKEGWNDPSNSILWHDSAVFLHKATTRVCIRVHLHVAQLFRKRGRVDEDWLTFERTMQSDRLSPFGACMLALWLLDSLLPAEVRMMIGIAEPLKGGDMVPVILVMEAGLMVIDPTRRVTGLFPRKLSKLKHHMVERCFDITGSYTLNSVVVDLPRNDID